MAEAPGLYTAKPDGFWWSGPRKGTAFNAADGFVLGFTKPEAYNTGPTTAQGAMSRQDGDITVTTAGTILENLDIRGFVFIRAANVIVRNCRIGGSGPGTTNGGLVNANHSAASNLLVERCELTQDFPWFWTDGVVGHDYTARRNNVYGTVDGFGGFNSGNSNGPANVTLEGNYVHDHCFVKDPSEPHSDHATHNDGFQIQGNSNYSVVGNNFQGYASATAGNGSTQDAYYPRITGQCIGLTPSVGAISGVVINRNWIYGAARGITAIQGSFAPAASLGSITNNRFSRDSQLGLPIKIENTLTATISGNVYDDDGSPVTATYVAVGG